MTIPNTHATLLIRGFADVPFDDDRTCRGTAHGEDHVADFEHAGVAGEAYLYDGTRMGYVLKTSAGAHE